MLILYSNDIYSNDNRSLVRNVIIAILVLAVAPILAGQPKEWVTLTGCQYLDAPDNDGDSFRMRGGTKEFTARLYYVDAPETNLRQAERTRDQSIHFGITLDETMKAGVKAKDRVRELLKKPFVIWTRWATAAGRARESRYYVIVQIDGKNLGEILISEGLARTKGMAPNLPTGEKARDYMQRLEDLEREACKKRTGAWATSTIEKCEERDQVSPDPWPQAQ
jgi:endonuclease YncB( thermonuclease family)